MPARDKTFLILASLVLLAVGGLGLLEAVGLRAASGLFFNRQHAQYLGALASAMGGFGLWTGWSPLLTPDASTRGAAGADAPPGSAPEAGPRDTHAPRG